VARARSRKRRPTGAKRPSAGAGEAASGAGAAHRRGRSEGRSASSAKKARSSPSAPSYGERPNAPWHPLPLSELLILIGAIGAALGLVRSGHDIANGGRLLLAGLGAVAIGTIEVTLREHRSGYRSHTVMLSLMLVLVFDSVLVFALTSFTSLSRLFTVGLLAVDIALFAVFFKMLRARFLDARHARVIREG
jgi:hypothetical protein